VRSLKGRPIELAARENQQHFRLKGDHQYSGGQRDVAIAAERGAGVSSILPEKPVRPTGLALFVERHPGRHFHSAPGWNGLDFSAGDPPTYEGC